MRQASGADVKNDAGNARARMNRAQKRAMPKILADKVGGKKKLAAMLEEAKARARAADAAKATTAKDEPYPARLPRDTEAALANSSSLAPPPSESDFDQ